MTLTSEYQYIGRSNAVKDQNSQHSYYLLLYAKTSEDTTTGRHTVTVKQRLASTSSNRFYGWASSGSIAIAGTEVTSWAWQIIPAAEWTDSRLTEDGVTYPCWVDLREGSLSIDAGYGVTKDINVGASWVLNAGTAGYLPQINVTAAVSATVTLPMIAGASQPSVSAASVELGKPVTVYTNRIAGTGFTHKLTYQFMGASGTIAENVGDSFQWTPVRDLAYQIPNAVSGTAVITCQTYSGSTPIGSSKQVTLTLTVPESVVPMVSFTYTDRSGAKDKFETLVQNISNLIVDGDGTGDYGSTIISTAMTLAGKSYGGGVIKESGSMVLTVSVTDSRGRTGSASETLNVAAYKVPSLSLNASRCTADGTADEEGTCAKITVSGHVTQVNGKNTAELKVTWAGGHETLNPDVGDIFWQTIVEADPDATMAISAVLSDKLTSTPRDMTLSTGYATLDLLAGGKGIALGKAATREGFDCAMPAYFSGGLYGIADGETEWENPPMVIGVEYRTTQRHNGKPVYAKAVTLSLAGSGYKSVYVATGVSEIVSMVGAYLESWGAAVAESTTEVSTVMFNLSNGYLQINSADMAGTTANYTVKYTK